MKKFPRLAIPALVLIAVHIFAPAALAHPLGNFTINHYAGLHVSPEAVQIDYVLDMAEIPAFQEIATFDANQNGKPEPGESDSYPLVKCEAIRSGLSLQINQESLPIRLVSSGLEFPPGQAGLLTLRLTCAFQASLSLVENDSPADQNWQLYFEDESFSERLGWREIVVIPEGITIQGDFPSISLSNRLRSYPNDMLSTPLNQRQIGFDFHPAATGNSVAAQSPSSQPNVITPNRNDAFTRLILLDQITLPTLLAAIAISFIWGAMHALTPGHGKTIVGAYLVGSRGTAGHALYLGLTTTITHTAGVFALGLITLFAAHFILPEKLFPWLTFLSGLLVLGIGASLFVRRLKGVGWFTRPGTHHSHPHSDQAHRHYHSHPDHHHIHDHGSAHGHANAEHDHNSSHEEHSSVHHTHLPPGTDGSPVTWRSLLALGISGGILPCPSALVVLLSAIALDRIGFGLVLVLSFSLGLAGVLTGIGLIFVYAGRLFERMPIHNRTLGLLPALSALVIALAGLAISARALMEIGLIEL